MPLARGNHRVERRLTRRHAKALAKLPAADREKLKALLDRDEQLVSKRNEQGERSCEANRDGSAGADESCDALAADNAKAEKKLADDIDAALAGFDGKAKKKAADALRHDQQLLRRLNRRAEQACTANAA